VEKSGLSDWGSKISSFQGSGEWRWKSLRLPDMRSPKIMIHERRISIDRSRGGVSIVDLPQRIYGISGIEIFKERNIWTLQNEAPIRERKI
jgi:hypothetical protein